ncbi:MAG: hypothetical protein NTY09_00685 [bacterium]|nr:hypothetical protein [bacterium]
MSDYFKESDLAMLKNIQRLFLAALILGLLVSTGCTGNSDAQNTSNNGDNGDGRIIVPETDWTPADADNNSETAADQPETDGNSNATGETSVTPANNEETGNTDTSGTADNGDTESEITINIFINGVQTEFGHPVELYQGQPFEVLIRMSSTIFEMVYYWVTTSDTRDTDIEGELSGYDAELKYDYIYNYTSWENGGLSVIVKDALGNITMQNVLLVPSEPDPVRSPG